VRWWQEGAQLAQRTKEATDDIGVMVRAITEEAERAASGMNSLSSKVLEAAQNVEKVHTLLNSIERSSSQSQEQIEEIAVASREHVQTTQENRRGHHRHPQRHAADRR
jgi:methyl-accepting chemotaxis protein